MLLPWVLGCMVTLDAPAADLGAAHAPPHPWQMRDSTPARTGQSPAAGASQGQLDWKFPIAGIVPQIAVAQDGTLYLGTVFNENPWNNEAYAYALTSTGDLRWRRKVTPYAWGASQATSGGPAVDDGGNVLIPSTNTQLLKLTGDGDSLWVHQGSSNAIIQGSPAVLPDQTIRHTIYPERLIAKDAAGNTLYTGPAFNSGATVAVGANGEMALGGLRTDKRHGSVDIQYFNADGTLRWQRTSSNGAQGTPVIGPDGVVYAPFLAKAFFPDGTAKWSTDVTTSTAALSDSGVLYFPSGGVVAVLAATGARAWTTTITGGVLGEPAIDALGNVFVTTSDGVLWSVSPTGGINWSLSVCDRFLTGPVIASGGRVVAAGIAGNQKYVFAVRYEGAMKPVLGLSVLVALAQAAAASAQLPAYHGNAQRTGASAARGPVSPVLLWSLDLQGEIISSPVVGPDGTIYLGSVIRDTRHPEHFITAVAPDGVARWQFPTGWWDTQTLSSPALGPDGKVYVGAQDGYFYALHPDGTLAWRFAASKPVQQHPVVHPDGTIYVGMNGRLYAFAPDGTVLWSAVLGTTNLPGGPSLSPDGQTIYAFGHTSTPVATLYAFNRDGTVRWQFDGFYGYYPALSPPTVAADGTVMVLSGQVVAIGPDGVERWRYDPSAAYYSSYASVAVNPAGEVVFAVDWYLAKLNADGTAQWQIEFLGGDYMDELESTLGAAPGRGREDLPRARHRQAVDAAVGEGPARVHAGRGPAVGVPARRGRVRVVAGPRSRRHPLHRQHGREAATRIGDAGAAAGRTASAR